MTEYRTHLSSRLKTDTKDGRKLKKPDSKKGCKEKHKVISEEVSTIRQFTNQCHLLITLAYTYDQDQV